MPHKDGNKVQRAEDGHGTTDPTDPGDTWAQAGTALWWP